MTMVQPVLKDDLFAGPAWNMCVTLLALEKLRAREELDDRERRAVMKTAEFIRSLVDTPRDNDPSPEANRNRKFRRQNFRLPKAAVRVLDLQLQALREYLESGSPKGILPFLSQIEIDLLNTLEVITYCRRS